MNGEVAVLVFVAASILSGAAVAQDAAPAKVPARGGVALQLEVSTGGDELGAYDTERTLGEGMTLSLGGFYRLSKARPWELQAFIGWKQAWIAPMTPPGYEGDVSRWVFQLLANYRLQNKWHFGGGLVFHGHPQFQGFATGGTAVRFHSAVGAIVEGGWSWLGMQCTYIEYGSLDASNCGVRLTWRFRKG